MNAQELEHILTHRDKKTKIGSESLTDSGQEHPLWTILNGMFQPDTPWRQLHGSVREGICRAGKILHEHNIPFAFFADYIRKLGKGYLKYKPLTLVGYKIKKNNEEPVLREYIVLIEYMIGLYCKNKLIIEINDAAYKMYPESYKLGVRKLRYSLSLIEDALRTKSEADILNLLPKNETIDDFWNALGTTTEKAIPIEVDLSAGVDHSEAVKLLNNEAKVRQGLLVGQPNPLFNKYFNKQGKLNAYGIKVIAGDKSL